MGGAANCGPGHANQTRPGSSARTALTNCSTSSSPGEGAGSRPNPRVGSSSPTWLRSALGQRLPTAPCAVPALPASQHRSACCALSSPVVPARAPTSVKAETSSPAFPRPQRGAPVECASWDSDVGPGCPLSEPPAQPSPGRVPRSPRPWEGPDPHPRSQEHRCTLTGCQSRGMRSLTGSPPRGQALFTSTAITHRPLLQSPHLRAPRPHCCAHLHKRNQDRGWSQRRRWAVAPSGQHPRNGSGHSPACRQSRRLSELRISRQALRRLWPSGPSTSSSHTRRLTSVSSSRSSPPG